MKKHVVKISIYCALPLIWLRETSRFLVRFLWCGAGRGFKEKQNAIIKLKALLKDNYKLRISHKSEKSTTLFKMM